MTLARIPASVPVPQDFVVTTEILPDPAPGQIAVEIETLSLDPYLRSLLGGRHLADAPVLPGDVIPGRAVARVLHSTVESVAVGTLVLAETGWRARAVIDAAATTPIDVPDTVPPSAALGALGVPGLTAHAAITRHLRPEPGQTVVIGAATGGVGSVAGALATRAGARTVALVGSRAKRRIALESGYDEAIDRTSAQWRDELVAACPDGIDGYLHLGDQATLDVVLEYLAIGARVSLCGLMDQYNGAAPTRLRAGAVMSARALVHGMVVYDHADLAAEHRATVVDLIATGALVLHEERHRGLAAAPSAFAGLMAGRNQGKVLVDLDVDRGGY